MEGQQKEIDINKIELDVNNPRIKRWTENMQAELEPGKIIPEKSILLFMKTSASSEISTDKTESVMTYAKLKNSIVENKGILNPILVKKLPNNAYKCIEGNTRLAIYKLQNDKDPEEACWQTIKCTVYEKITEEEENKIRLQSHLVPPRPWDPYSRAKFLNHLIENENFSIEKVAGVCGMHSVEVSNYLDTFEIMEEYYKPYCLSKGDLLDVKSFSGFFELIKRPSLIRTITELNYDYTNFSEWIHGRNKITQLSHVRQLERILKNVDARKIFIAKGSSEALKVFATLLGTTNLQNATILELIKATTDKLNIIPFFEMKTLAENTSLLDDCAELINLCQQCLDTTD